MLSLKFDPGMRPTAGGGVGQGSRGLSPIYLPIFNLGIFPKLHAQKFYPTSREKPPYTNLCPTRRQFPSK